jgi:hypothetical protein
VLGEGKTTMCEVDKLNNKSSVVTVAAS